MTFRVRRVAPEEAARLGALAGELFRETYGPTHPEPTLSAYVAECFAPDAVRRRLADEALTVLVVESDEGEWLGYAELRVGTPDGARATPDRPLPSSRGLEIARFYVVPRHHGQGVAQALMRSCEALASEAGHELLWLQAWQEAAQALRFYAKEGFARYGTAVFQFGDRLDHDFLLVKVLRGPGPVGSAHLAQRRSGGPH